MIFPREQKSILMTLYRYYGVTTDRYETNRRKLELLTDQFNYLTSRLVTCPLCDPNARPLSFSPGQTLDNKALIKSCSQNCGVSPDFILRYMLNQRKNRTWPLLGRDPKPQHNLIRSIPRPEPPTLPKITYPVYGRKY